MIMLLCVAWSMELAGWVEGLYVVEWTALGGLVLGFLMTRAGWPRAFRHLAGIMAGAWLVVAAMTRYIGPGSGWRDGLDILSYHFDVWLRTVVAGQSSADPTMFVLLMTLLGWWLGYSSAWMVFGTHKVWHALALTGGAMLLVVYGSPPEVAPFFVLFIFCALLLAVRMYVYTQEQSWDSEGAHYDRDIGFYFLRDGGLLVAIVVTVIWIVPLLSSSSALSGLWARVGGPWHAVGDEWNQLFSGIKGYRQDYANIPFGQQLPLGGPIDLGDEIVMWVETEGGRYWRGAVYDLYDGTGWQNTDDLNATIAADRHLPRDGEYELRYAVVQTVVPNWSGVGQVFGIGQPASVDVPLEIQYSLTEVGAEEGRDPLSASATVSLIKSRIPLNRERPYTVISSSSVADAESLREAGEVYPTWVTRRYLQLPSALPPRVGELAQGVVAPHDNAYDRAIALQDYLRRTIEYREDIEPRPPDRDPIDYLLFDSREGYCNYYASAMVVMARAVGIPSRLAVGYVGGQFDDETGQYAVRERDTHAWVEVFFPRYGWMEFEPTASEAPIVRPTMGEDALRDELRELRAHRPESDTPFEVDLSVEGMSEPSSVSALGDWGTMGWMIGLLMMAGSAGAAGFWMIRKRWRKGPSRAERLYRALATYGRLLGVRAQACHTPHEYATLLTEKVPERRWEIRRIVTLYVQDRFSYYGIGPGEEAAAGEAWRRLRRTLWGKLPRAVLGTGRRVLRWPRQWSGPWGS